jgi:hypothetical protein
MVGAKIFLAAGKNGHPVLIGSWKLVEQLFCIMALVCPCHSYNNVLNDQTCWSILDEETLMG